MKLGIIANEFFEPSLGRMGGFGWTARQVTCCFNAAPDLGVIPQLLTSDPSVLPGAVPEKTVAGTRLRLFRADDPGVVCKLRCEEWDLLLTIDYRPNYRSIVEALPAVPLIIWVRDPHSPDDQARLATLRIPHVPGVRPASALDHLLSLGPLFSAARAAGRPVGKPGSLSGRPRRPGLRCVRRTVTLFTEYHRRLSRDAAQE